MKKKKSPYDFTDSDDDVVELGEGIDLHGVGVRLLGSLPVVDSLSEMSFDMFLDFPKPIIAAINGPAIGASVTSATLCDAIIMAEEGATLSTPFARLGVPPEGC